MRNGWNWIGWGVVVGLTSFPAWSAEPDPEAVRRLMEKYEREAAEEAAKQAPAPKPRPKPEPAPQPKPKPAPTVNYDHEAWKSAERCGTAACFRAYLEDYPKGRYARMARARLEPESTSPPAAAERPKPPSRPVQTLLVDRYWDNGDGTVTDVKTRLQWMRCSLGQKWQGGTCVGEAEKYDWQSAPDAAKAMNHQGGYASYRDWRVPTKEELETLFYCSSGKPKTWNDTGISCKGDFKRPPIYQTAFPNTREEVYWSSSVHAHYPDIALGVAFLHVVAVYAGSKANDLHHARLVRGEQ